MDNNKDLQQAKMLNQQSAQGGGYSNAADSIRKGAEEAKKLNQQSAQGGAASQSFANSISNMNNADGFELEQAKQENQKSARKKKG